MTEALNLRGNKLAGPMPKDIAKLRDIGEFSLSLLWQIFLRLNQLNLTLELSVSCTTRDIISGFRFAQQSIDCNHSERWLSLHEIDE